MKAIFAASFALILCFGCSKQHPNKLQPVAKDEPFFVHLQEGFSGEPTKISVDGKLIFEGNPKTDPLQGVAHELTGTASSTLINMTIEIPSKKIKSTHSFDLIKAKGFGISVVNGQISIVQANAFGYD